MAKVLEEDKEAAAVVVAVVTAAAIAAVAAVAVAAADTVAAEAAASAAVSVVRERCTKQRAQSAGTSVKSRLSQVASDPCIVGIASRSTGLLDRNNFFSFFLYSCELTVVLE